MRIVLFLGIVSLVCFGCTRARHGASEVHVLSWKDYDGRTAPEQAVYVLDGHAIGKGADGIAALKSREFVPGSVVRIKMPWVLEPSGPDLMPPYVETDLLSFLKAKGVVVEIEEKWTDGVE